MGSGVLNKLSFLMNNIDYIIMASLNGTATQQELDQLQAWLLASPLHDKIYREILEYWFATEEQVDQDLVATVWKNVARNHLGGFEPIQHPKSSTAITMRRILQIAASLLLVGIITYFLYDRSQNKEIHIYTHFEEIKEVTLPDQSRVILNANSHLWYKKNSPRNVRLKGEAFFDIQKQLISGEKFSVATRDLDVEVLGTIFNVNSYEDLTSVFLEEGEIKLGLAGRPKEEIYLAPGDLVTYSVHQSDSFQKVQSDSDTHTSWKKGSLILKMTPLSDVLNKLELIYGIKIQTANNSLLDRRVTLAVPIENLDIGLAALENALGVEIQKKHEGEYHILTGD